MTMLLMSDGFKDGERLDAKYTCDGAGVSPGLSWVGGLEDIKSYALIVHDPDALKGDVTHWLVWDIPLGTNSIAEGQAGSTIVGISGANVNGKLGWTPACPPPGDGMHRYMFELYGLNTASLSLAEGATREQVENAVREHTVDQAHIEATYQRG